MVGKLIMENDTLKEIIELVEPQKKASQQIFTSADWEALGKGEDKWVYQGQNTTTSQKRIS